MQHKAQVKLQNNPFPCTDSPILHLYTYKFETYFKGRKYQQSFIYSKILIQSLFLAVVVCMLSRAMYKTKKTAFFILSVFARGSTLQSSTRRPKLHLDQKNFFPNFQWEENYTAVSRSDQKALKLIHIA